LVQRETVAGIFRAMARRNGNSKDFSGRPAGLFGALPL
jgi:hypothetical protein